VSIQVREIASAAVTKIDCGTAAATAMLARFLRTHGECFMVPPP